MTDTPDDIRRVLDLVAAHDYLQVRPALIRELDGNANAAVLFTLIQWRTTGQYGPHYERDGRQWWRATLDDLVEESGMKKDPVRTALKLLISRGLIITEAHKQQGTWDKTLSYRVVTTADLPDPVGSGPHRDGLEPTSDVGSGPHLPYRDKETHHLHHNDDVEAVDNSAHHADSVGDEDVIAARKFKLTPNRKKALNDVLADCGVSYAIPQWNAYIRTVDYPEGEKLMARWFGIREAMRHGERNRRDELNHLLSLAGVADVSDEAWNRLLASTGGTLRLDF